MSVGQLLSSLLQGAQSTKLAADVVELKPGQVVRGTVLRLISNQEALLSIQGVKVHAKLEAPLQQGDSTWLTVLADRGDGQIRLKPVAGVRLQGSGLTELLKALGLPDTPNNRQLVQLLSQSGLPITKQSIASLAALSAQRSADIDAEQWNQAAILALKRGLPAEASHVGALRQAIYGQPLHQMLLDVQTSLAQLLSRAGAGLSANTMKALSDARSSIDNVILQSRAPSLAASQQLTASPPLAASSQLTASPPLAASPQAVSGGASSNIQIAANYQTKALSAVPADPASVNLAVSALTQEGASLSAEPFPRGERSSQGHLANQAINPLLLNEGAVKPAAGHALQSADDEGKPLNSSQNASGVSAVSAASSANAAAASQVGSGMAAAAEGWVAKLFKSLGLDHESALLKAETQPEESARSAGGGKTFTEQDGGARSVQTLTREPTNGGAGTHSQLYGPWTASAERIEIPTLKAALLSLLANGDLPEPVRESVQQVVQQLTGQQLLLGGDRSSPITYFTLAIPLFSEGHQQTASVHVQSRKTASGSIDVDNCRLWFDLNLAHLGHTLLDVQVLNRVVSITVHSDFEQLDTLLAGSREDLNERLQDMGYSMLTMKVQPLPERAAAADANSPDLQMKSAYYDTKPYKGVDLRV
ncbi:hypothetical protein [Paenibacillus senegalensis]|uniref:hypothetical protein n=1 Tax=Paenibacillus senegalensis TaxID=1465766 RepID=UPI000474D605|nr:hypothetical protein [Paenibacillus senegalensis]